MFFVVVVFFLLAFYITEGPFICVNILLAVSWVNLIFAAGKTLRYRTASLPPMLTSAFLFKLTTYTSNNSNISSFLK